MQPVWTQIRPDKTSGSEDGIPEINIFEKVNFEK